jgi:naphthoate synthase
MGLVNKVVPRAELLTEATSWAAEIANLSPTAIKFCKYSFNADTEHHAAIEKMSGAGLDLYLESQEAGEFFTAFSEKRPPRPTSNRGE